MKNSDRIIDINWDFIVAKILQEQCVLVLGPEVFVDDKNVDLQKKLIDQLNVENNDNISRYYQKEGFFLFDDPYKRTLICHTIKSFYNDISCSELLCKIAKIPFHVILTVTPDVLIQKAFSKQNFDFQSGYYKKDKPPQTIKPPSRNFPLIYNVFGSVNSEESMILTHNDLYDYFKSIFARKSMPDHLKLLLREVKNIIFLGVPFEKWYMQLLLRELDIHKLHYEFTRFAANISITDDLRTFCHEQFKVNFIPHNIAEFVEELYSKFDQKDLRETKGKERTIANRLKKYVASGTIDDALDILQELTIDTELENEVSLWAGRNRNFRRRQRNGIIKSEDTQVLGAQLLNNFIELIDQAERMNLLK